MTILLNDIKRELNSFTVKGIDSIVFLTYRCTSQCKTCNIWRRNAEQGSELDWAGWKRVFERLKAYGINTVELFGGDALLRKDVLFKIIRYCTDNGIKTYFPTNSILLDRETARNLVDAGLSTLYISLDGVGAENDRIRGKEDSFTLVKRALENIISAKKGCSEPKIIICSTISSLNYDKFYQVVDFLRDYPVDAIYPRCVGEFSSNNIESSQICGIKPEPFFISSEGTSHLLSQDEIKSFRMTIKTLKSGEKHPYINFRNVDCASDKAFTSGEYEMKRCHVCTTLMTINPNGDVSPCLFYPGYVLGNLHKQDVCEVWGNEMHRAFISSQRKGSIKICENCLTRTYYPNLTETVMYLAKRLVEKCSIA